MANLQQFLSRLPSRGKPARRVATSEVIDAVGRLAGADQILLYLDSAIREIFDASSASVSLLEPITGRFVERKTAASGHPSPSLDFTPSDRLVSWLVLNQTPAAFCGERDLRGFLTPPELDRINARGIRATIPMFAADRLVGLLHLGSRRNGSRYDTSDLRELVSIAHQAASSLERASAHDVSDAAVKKLFFAEKLATVGELAAGAAHEIRNPLTLIRGAVQIATGEVPPARRPLLEAALHEADRIDTILKGLLSLSRTSRLDTTQFSVAELISQSILLLEPEIRKRDVEVEVDILPLDTLIRGDRSQLQQALLNILLNATQAMNGGGQLRVSVVDGQPLAMRGDPVPALVIQVSDSGKGIPPENLPRVFDPFFTTREEGTGLGLSISYGIIARHGGEISVESSADAAQHGTCVTVTLPRNGISEGVVT